MAYIRHHASTSTITSSCEVRITCRRVASCTPSTSKDSVVFTPLGFRKLSARSASKRSVVCTQFGGNFAKLRETHGVIRRYTSRSTKRSLSANRIASIRHCVSTSTKASEWRADVVSFARYLGCVEKKPYDEQQRSANQIASIRHYISMWTLPLRMKKSNGLHSRSDVYTPSGSRNFAKF